MSAFPRIIYNSINVDLSGKFNQFRPDNRQRQLAVSAASGVTEQANYFDGDIIEAIRERITAQELVELRQWYETVKDGTSFELLRDRDLGAHLAFENSLKDMNEVAGTFTRTAGTAGNCSYIDPSTGLVTFVDAADTPRYPAGKYGSGLLVEADSTNLIDESEDFDQWTASNITVTTNTTKTLDPSGGSTADILAATATDGYVEIDTGTALGANEEGVFSVWLKSAEQTGNVSMEISVRSTVSGELQTDAITVTPTWQRFEVVAANVSASGNWLPRIIVSTSGEQIFAWGAQMEAGAAHYYATNYIRSTAGSQVSRNDEQYTFDNADDVFGELKGTIGMWVKLRYPAHNQHPTGTFLQIESNQGSGGLFAYWAFLGTGNFEFRHYLHDTPNYISCTVSGSGLFTQDTLHHICVTYDSTISDGLTMYVDGVSVASTTNDSYAPVPIGVDGTWALGSEAASAAGQIDGVIDDFFARKDVLSASQIQQIFNRGFGLGEMRNRWTALELVDPRFNPLFIPGGPNRAVFELIAKEVIS